MRHASIDSCTPCTSVKYVCIVRLYMAQRCWKKKKKFSGRWKCYFILFIYFQLISWCHSLCILHISSFRLFASFFFLQNRFQPAIQFAVDKLFPIHRHVRQLLLCSLSSPLCCALCVCAHNKKVAATRAEIFLYSSFVARTPLDFPLLVIHWVKAKRKQNKKEKEKNLWRRRRRKKAKNDVSFSIARLEVIIRKRRYRNTSTQWRGSSSQFSSAALCQHNIYPPDCHGDSKAPPPFSLSFFFVFLVPSNSSPP